jgi:hypothetical protein
LVRKQKFKVLSKLSNTTFVYSFPFYLNHLAYFVRMNCIIYHQVISQISLAIGCMELINTLRLKLPWEFAIYYGAMSHAPNEVVLTRQDRDKIHVWSYSTWHRSERPWLLGATDWKRLKWCGWHSNSTIIDETALMFLILHGWFTTICY